jgi:acetylornithine deacetylase/succinyl-diaminopimelate desuccinylase-like protein
MTLGELAVSKTNFQIREGELVELALALGNIDSPTGDEGEACQFVFDWMFEQGFAPKRIGMFEERFNVLGRIEGSSSGYSLVFNSHLDTGKHGDDQWSLRDARNPLFHSAWRDGDLLYGEGIVNDKGPMAAFLIAAKAIKDAGIELKGDLLISAVVGEIGMEPVDEFSSPRYLSKEAGARYLIQHGGIADYALIAEGTKFAAGWIEAGKAFFKITVHGDRQYYTPFTPDAEVNSGHPNAIVRTGFLIPQIQEWGRKYERRFRYESGGGTIVPKVTIGAIRGGNAYHVTRTSELCSLYLDVRIVPGQDPLAIRAELRRVLDSAGIPGEVELFLYRRAYEAQHHETLLESLAKAHTEVIGSELGIAAHPFTSMWRDISPFNEMGIPAITYGPGVAVDELALRVDDLVTAANVYARLALILCQTEKPAPFD